MGDFVTSGTKNEVPVTVVALALDGRKCAEHSRFNAKITRLFLKLSTQRPDFIICMLSLYFYIEKRLPTSSGETVLYIGFTGAVSHPTDNLASKNFKLRRDYLEIHSTKESNLQIEYQADSIRYQSAELVS